MQSNKLILLAFGLIAVILAFGVSVEANEDEAISDRRYRWAGSEDQVEDEDETADDDSDDVQHDDSDEVQHDDSDGNWDVIEEIWLPEPSSDEGDQSQAQEDSSEE